MGFSKEWEDRYKANTHLSVWPWSDLVSYVKRYSPPLGSEFKVLELGCGAGANIPFFIELGVPYYAIEGSSTIVKRLKKKFPELKNNIKVGDFTKEIPFSGQFNLIVDRASLAHNTTAAIKDCLALLFKKIKPKGRFIGINWFSTQHSDYQGGLAGEDMYTRRGYKEGPFAYIGRAHFSDKPHLLELFKKFNIVILEHTTIRREIPDGNFLLAYWNFVAEKKR